MFHLTLKTVIIILLMDGAGISARKFKEYYPDIEVEVLENRL